MKLKESQIQALTDGINDSWLLETHNPFYSPYKTQQKAYEFGFKNANGVEYGVGYKGLDSLLESGVLQAADFQLCKNVNGYFLEDK